MQADELTTGTYPVWAGLIAADEKRWRWRGGKLVADAQRRDASPPGTGLRKLILDYFYADHNRNHAVKRAMARTLARLDGTAADWGVNIGAGGMTLHPRVLNLDIFDSATMNIVHDGGTLPFRDESLTLAICQEVLEHVDNFGSLVSDIHRVLKPDGVFYVQVPFQIGYHSGPNDYWRFSHDGLRYLFDNEDWALEEIDISVGHGTGFYRIAVEYFAVTAAALSRYLYLPVKGLFALLLYPVKLADLVTQASPEKHRIPGGYYVIARKRRR